MRRLLLLCSVLPLTAVASEHWVRFTSGPVEIYGSVGSKDGRETLVTFEEFRHALGYMLGDNDVQMSLPIRILLFKTGAPQVREPVLRGRGQYNVVLTAGQPLSNEMFSRLTQLFLGASGTSQNPLQPSYPLTTSSRLLSSRKHAPGLPQSILLARRAARVDPATVLREQQS
jgi:hypothetical protein